MNKGSYLPTLKMKFNRLVKKIPIIKPAVELMSLWKHRAALIQLTERVTVVIIVYQERPIFYILAVPSVTVFVCTTCYSSLQINSKLTLLNSDFLFQALILMFRLFFSGLCFQANFFRLMFRLIFWFRL